MNKRDIINRLQSIVKETEASGRDFFAEHIDTATDGDVGAYKLGSVYAGIDRLIEDLKAELKGVGQ